MSRRSDAGLDLWAKACCDSQFRQWGGLGWRIAVVLSCLAFANSVTEGQDTINSGSETTRVDSAKIPDLAPGPLRVAAAELRAWAESISSDDKSSGYAGLLSQSDVQLRADGTRFVRHWTITQVTTQEAVRESIRMETTWSPFHSSRPTLKVRMIQPDGSELNLSGDQAIEQASGDSPAQGTIDDSKRLILLLAGLKTGSVIESVESYDFKPSIPGFSFSRHFMSGFGSLSLARLNVATEPGTTFRWDSAGWDIQPIEAVRGAGDAEWSRVSFEVQNPTPIMDELQSLCGPDTSSFPMIRISQGGTWNQAAQAYDKLFRPKVRGAAAMATQLVAGIDPSLPIKTLINTCADRLRSTIVYTGVEFGINRIVPYDAEEIIARGFGDCKDQSMMLVAMLAELNVEADVALISTGYTIDASTSMPTIAVFDHVIVRAIADGQHYWIDPTATRHPVNILPLACAGRRALIVRPDSNALTVTPRRRAIDDVFSTTSSIRIDGSGYGPQTESTRYSRYAAVRIRSAVSQPIETTEFREAIAELFGAKPENLELDFDSNLPDQLGVKVRYEPEQHAELDQQFLAIPFDLRSTLTEIPELFFPKDESDESQTSSKSKRRFNIVLPHAYAEQRVLRVELPSYYVLKTDIAPISVSAGPLQIRLNFEISDDLAGSIDTHKYQTITISARVVLDQDGRTISPDQLDQIRSFVGEWTAADSPLAGRLVFEDPARVNLTEVAIGMDQLTASLRRCRTYRGGVYEPAQLATLLREVGLPIAARTIASQTIAANQSHPNVRALLHEVLITGNDSLRFGTDWDMKTAQLLSKLELEKQQSSVQGLDIVSSLLVNERTLQSDDEQTLRKIAKLMVDALSQYQLAPGQDMLVRQRAALLLIRLREDRQAANLVRQNMTGIRSQNIMTQWLVDGSQSDNIWEWTKQHLEALTDSPIDDSTIAILLDRLILGMCGIERLDLGQQIYEAVRETEHKNDIRFRDASYFKPQTIPDPADIDASDPEQIARNGLATYMVGRINDETRYQDLDRLKEVPRMSRVDDKHFTKILGMPLYSWTNDAIRYAAWRLPLLVEKQAIGGWSFVFDVPSIAHREGIFVVPWDGNDQYRWIFANDNRALVGWARQAHSHGKVDVVIEIFDEFLNLAVETRGEPLAGSPAIRVWKLLKSKTDKQLPLMIAVFAIETGQATPEDIAIVKDAIRSSNRHGVRTQLLRSLNLWMESHDDDIDLFDDTVRLLKSYPNSLAIMRMMLQAAQKNGKMDQAKEVLRDGNRRRTASDKRLITLMIDIHDDKVGRAIATLLSFHDEFALASELGTVILNAAQSQPVQELRLNRLLDLQMETLGDDVSPANASALIRTSCLLKRPAVALKYLPFVQASVRNDTPEQLSIEASVCQALQLDGIAKKLHQRVVREHAESEFSGYSRRQLQRLESGK